MINFLAIVIPTFNDGKKLVTFLSEVIVHFNQVDFNFIIINDCSTDGTLNALSNYIHSNKIENKVIILNNEVNQGHGKTVLRGINYALKMNYSNILTVDSDHSIKGDELFKFYDKFIKSNYDIMEGVRYNFKTLWYRKIVSNILKQIVKIKSGLKTYDANTPVRIYSKQALLFLISKKHSNLVPNLSFSIISRKFNISTSFYILQQNIDELYEIGTTWNNKGKIFPPVKFIIFCIVAIFTL